MTIKIKFIPDPRLPKISKIDTGQPLQDSVYPNIDRHHLERLFGIQIHHLPSSVLENYKEILPEGLYLNSKLVKKSIVKNINQPYKSSIRCYCFGEYQASIILNGFVAEMLTNLYCLANNIKTWSDDKYKFKNTVKELKTNEYISDEQSKLFFDLINTRNNYTHRWKRWKNVRSEGFQKQDAKKCFFKLTNLLEELLLFTVQLNHIDTIETPHIKNVYKFIEMQEE